MKVLKNEFRATITPEMAATFLESMAANRSPRRNKVDAFARDMEDEVFLYNGDSIRFNARGQMIDGSHRCSAAVKAGKCFEADIVVGIDEDAAKTIDTGTSRNAADVLAIEGSLTPNEARLVAAFARYVMTHDAGYPNWAAHGGHQTKILTNARVFDWVSENYDEVEETLGWVRENTQAVSALLPRACFAALRVLTARDDGDLSHDFLRQVAMGLDIKEGSNADHARGILMAVALKNRKMPRWVCVLTVAKLFKSTLHGRSIKHVGNACFRPTVDKPPTFPMPADQRKKLGK